MKTLDPIIKNYEKKLDELAGLSWAGASGASDNEAPLLDVNGPLLVAGDALTIEPGLYCRDLGGIRVEDMVIVTEDGCVNLNHLPEGLDWS